MVDEKKDDRRSSTVASKCNACFHREVVNAFYFSLLVAFTYICYVYACQVESVTTPLNYVDAQPSVGHYDDYDDDVDEESRQTAGIVLLFLFGGLCVGYLAEKVHLPRPLAMILFGVLLRHIHIGEHGSYKCYFLVRRFAFVLILAKSALSFDYTALKQKSRKFLLTIKCPSVLEIVVVTFLASFLLDIDFAASAVIATAIVASCPFLQVKAEKSDKMKQLTNVLLPVELLTSLFLFVTALAIMYSEDFDFNLHDVAGLIAMLGQAVYGVLFGGITGILMEGCPDGYRPTFFLLAILGGFSFFDRYRMFLAGVCTVFTTVAVYSNKSRASGKSTQSELQEEVWLDHIWGYLFEPLLYTLLAFQLPLTAVDGHSIYATIVLVVIIVFARIAVSLLFPWDRELPSSERITLSLLSLERSSVQAALALMPIEICLARNTGIDGFFAIPSFYSSSKLELSSCFSITQEISIVLAASIMIFPLIGRMALKLQEKFLNRQKNAPGKIEKRESSPAKVFRKSILLGAQSTQNPSPNAPQPAQSQAPSVPPKPLNSPPVFPKTQP